MAPPMKPNFTDIQMEPGCSEGIAEAMQYCSLENGNEDCPPRCERSLENIKNCTAAKYNPPLIAFSEKCNTIVTKVNSASESVIYDGLVFAVALSVLTIVTATGSLQYL
eukprot:TRINITY_DN5833_c0_g1_i2.p1 TRINITY_DN5833_c0_g1~~TRINITY_DN5833_c0_g1_i2.p1  ORF type:complete len:109 (-),score=10.93 TRINITY_DN5833_c0_g1_i2:34-360(-)